MGTHPLQEHHYRSHPMCCGCSAHRHRDQKRQCSSGAPDHTEGNTLAAQNRESGHQVQGRDRSAHHAFRSSMSDPVYYVRSSMSDPSYPGPQRGMVTPQVNVAEGTGLNL